MFFVMVFYPRRMSQTKRGSKRRRNGTLISKPRRSTVRGARVPKRRGLSVLALCLLKVLAHFLTPHDTMGHPIWVFPIRLGRTHQFEESHVPL